MLGENSYLELTRNYEDDLTLVLRGLKLRGKAQVYLNINKNFGFSWNSRFLSYIANQLNEFVYYWYELNKT